MGKSTRNPWKYMTTAKTRTLDIVVLVAVVDVRGIKSGGRAR
jgi:hypothetical protein